MTKNTTKIMPLPRRMRSQSTWHTALLRGWLPGLRYLFTVGDRATRHPREDAGASTGQPPEDSGRRLSSFVAICLALACPPSSLTGAWAAAIHCSHHAAVGGPSVWVSPAAGERRDRRRGLGGHRRSPVWRVLWMFALLLARRPLRRGGLRRQPLPLAAPGAKSRRNRGLIADPWFLTGGLCVFRHACLPGSARVRSLCREATVKGWLSPGPKEPK